MPSVEERVDSLGFGRAQITYLIIGGVITATMSCQFCLVPQLTIPATGMYNIGSSTASLLATTLFLGMMIGTGVSGYLGDRLGRRMPVCISAVAVPMFGALSAVHVSYSVLLAVRFFMGFFLAFGEVPLNALLNELTPTKWKIVMRSLIEVFFYLGYTFSALLTAIQDPYLRNIAFGKLSLMASIPTGVLAIAIMWWLPESPVFLASQGRMEEARKVLADIQRLNKKNDQALDFSPPPVQKTLSGMEQCSIIFGRKYRRATLILAYSTFIIKFYLYGGMYTMPMILSRGHGLLPAWEIVIGGPISLVGTLLAATMATYCNRKDAMSIAMLVGAVGSFCYAFAAVRGSHGLWMQCMYHFGATSFYWVESMAIIILSQLSLEAYPTTTSSTGGSVASMMGRFGCVISPMASEGLHALTGSWKFFCYLLITGCVLGAFMFAVLWESKSESADDAIKKEMDPTLPLRNQEEGIADNQTYMNHTPYVSYGAEKSRAPTEADLSRSKQT